MFVVMRKGEVLGEEDVRAWVRGGLGGHFGEFFWILGLWGVSLRVFWLGGK